jgi:predicted alpha/beta hydrolase family esterase
MDKNSNENSEKNIKYEDIFDPDDHVRIKWIMELASYQRMDDSVWLIIMLHVFGCPICYARLAAAMNGF